MGKQAFLFKLLVEYFNQTEESIELSIIENVEEKINILLEKIKSKANTSKKRKSIVDPKVSKIFNILDDVGVLIEKAEKGERKSGNSIDGIKLIKILTKLLISLEQGATVTTNEMFNISNYFEKIRNLEIKAGGLSDSSIDRMKNKEDMWNRPRIENLYTYWFEPLYKNEKDFIKDFDNFLNTKLKEDKIQIIYDIKDFLKDQDKYIDCNCFWQLFRRMKIEKGETRSTVENDDVWRYIVSEIKNAFNNNTPEPIGLCEDEVQKITSDLVEQLIIDLTVYCKKEDKYTKIVRKENFRALIRYRLCNKLYNYIDNNSVYRMLAFRIFQEEFPGNICIHPAAIVDSKVFISNYVMIGKQCHVHSETYLNDYVCLFPFKSYEKEMEDSYIVIGEGCILDKFTKIIGAVEIGRNCYINFNGIISKDIEELSEVGEQNEIRKMKESDYLEILNRVKGEIYE